MSKMIVQVLIRLSTLFRWSLRARKVEDVLKGDLLGRESGRGEAAKGMGRERSGM